MTDKKGLKESKYNVQICLSDEEQAIFNFKTLKSITWFDGEKIPETKLVEGGFLIDETRDEIKELKDKCFEAIESSDELALSITPTMNCQFACPYCFQERRYSSMNNNTTNALIDFVRKSFEKYNHKALRVHWFGGEPLLEMTRIEEITDRLKSICEQYRAGYRSFMVSNGYLLNQEMAKRLEAIDVSYVRVTVDGPPEHHDRSRVLKDGGGTFGVIDKNFRELDTDVEIKIKTNLHRDNTSVIEWMRKWVDELNGRSKTIFSYSIAYVDCGSAVFDSSDSFGILSREEFETIAFGSSLIQPLAPIAYPCNSTRRHYYAIDEDGSLYKCCDMVGNDKAVFGNIFDYEPGTLNYEIPDQALAFRENAFPEGDSECMNCVVLPICLGRCIRSRAMLNSRSCMVGKGHIEDTVKHYLRYEREKQAE